MYDSRYPLFLGFWSLNRNGFTSDNFDEPHMKRKRVILSKYSEISTLYGYDKSTGFIALGAAILFVVGCPISGILWNRSIFGFVLFCYFWGGSLVALSGVIVHECCHLSAAASLLGNQVIAILANVPVAVPMAATFKKFHQYHHLYLGVVGKDPDLPMNIEVWFFDRGVPLRVAYVLLYPLFYALRGYMIDISMNMYELANFGIHICLIVAVYYMFGLPAIIFWVISTWFGFSIHPAAAHLLQEHFITQDGQETYSYYGTMNKLFMNIGYHNEHHDFPSVPWSQLPKVKILGGEYYSKLKSYDSWLKIILAALFTDAYRPSRRVVRTIETHNRGREMEICEKEENFKQDMQTFNKME